MADFTISGTVEIVGSVSTLVGAELEYDFLLAEFSFSQDDVGHRERGLFYTDDNGDFAITFDIPDSVVGALQPYAVLILSVRPHFPAEGIEIQTGLQGSASENFQEAQDLASGLHIAFDIAASESTTLNFGLRDDFPALEDVDSLRLHLVAGEGGFVLATALARRVGEARFQANLLYMAGPAAPTDCWILLHDGGSYRSAGYLGPDEVGRVFARTRDIPVASMSEAAEDELLLMQVDTATGVGTVSDKLPDQITQGALISRDLDVDFVDGRMRVRGRLGTGVNGFQLFEIGRFEAFFDITPPDRELTPFTASEFEDPVDVTVSERSFDIFPGTDLDDFGGMLGIESFFAVQVATRIRDEIRDAIAEEVGSVIDGTFEEIEESLAWTDDPEGLADEIRSTLSLHIAAVRLTDDDIEVQAFAGIWHWVSALASLDCAANTASLMFATRRPLPMFRRYKKVLSKESLEPWMERYRQLSPELARIARRSPLWTSRAISFGFDLLPVLNPEGRVPLTTRAAEEFAVLAEEVAAQGSEELAEFMERAATVLARGAGRTLPELTRLAAGTSPGGPPQKPATKERKG